MPDAITVVALQPVSHGGRSFVPGEVFEVAPIDAAVLVYSQSVRFAESGEKVIRQLHEKIVRCPQAPDVDAYREGLQQVIGVLVSPAPSDPTPARRRGRRSKAA